MGTCCSIINTKYDQLHSNFTVYQSKKDQIQHGTSTNNKQHTGNQNSSALPLRSKSYKECKTALLREHEKTDPEVQMILIALNRHFILSQLDEQTKNELISHMQLYVLGPNEVVFTEGCPGHSFFIVFKGELHVSVEGKKVRTLSHGTGFGELALLNDHPRTATVTTAQKCSLWVVDRDTFHQALKEINDKNYNENKNFIELFPGFKLLGAKQKDSLLEASVEQCWAPGKKIIREGEKADFLYFIKEGKVVCSYSEEFSREMTKGEYFGELAILHESRRTADIVTLEKTILLALSKTKLEEVFGDSLYKIFLKNSMRIAMERSYLKELKSEQIEYFVTNFEPIQYADNEKIICKGQDYGEALYIILLGRVRIKDRVYGGLSCIGDDCLDKEGTYADDCVSQGKTVISIVTKQDLEIHIGGKYLEIIELNEKVSIVMKNRVFHFLSTENLNKIANSMEFATASPGQTIFTVGEPASFCIYLVNGALELYKGDAAPVKVIANSWMDDTLMITGPDRLSTAVAVEHAEYWIIHKAQYLGALSTIFKESLIESLSREDLPLLEEPSDRVGVLPMNSKAHRIIVRDSTGKHCLHKVYTKSIVIQHNLLSRINNEISCLKQMFHPMIVQFIQFRKEENQLSLFLEYSQGISLKTYTTLKRNQENEVSFFIACLVLVLEYFSERKVIHRNLTVDTIFIDKWGYPKVTDFSCAKILNGRTYSVLGDPHYAAPEVIIGRGYTHSADWWALGVIAHFLMYRKYPLTTNDDDPFKIYNRILSYSAIFSKTAISGSSHKNFIARVMNKDPSLRLPGGFPKMKNHQWFSGIVWGKLNSKEIPPSFTPVSELEYIHHDENYLLDDSTDYSFTEDKIYIYDKWEFNL